MNNKNKVLGRSPRRAILGKPALWGGFVSLSVLSVGIWLALSSYSVTEDESASAKALATASAIASAHNSKSDSQVQTSLNTPKVSSISLDPDDADSDELYVMSDVGKSFFSGVEAKTRLAQVANDFASDIQYPHFSKPIRDEAELAKYIPNKSLPSQVSVNPRDETSMRVSINASKHRYFSGETIEAEIAVSNAQIPSDVLVTGRILALGKVYSEEKSLRVDMSNGSAQLQFELPIADPSRPERLSIVVGVQSGDDFVELGTPIEYLNAIARVTDLGESSVSGEYLSIPVGIATSDPGFHEVSGILYSASNGAPLLHLNQQAELESNEGWINLKAHIAALKVGGDEGPYELRNVTLSRMPSRPSFRTEYGIVPNDAFAVSAHAFDQYDDVPYQDPDAQSRLEFLKQIAQN